MERKVEVILPLYNPSSWVISAVKSVINQTYEHCHLTIIDDASSDRTWIKNIENIVRENKNRISFFSLKNNIGAAGARNRAARITDAEYISFIDQDDMYKLGKVQKQVNILNQKDAKLVHGNIVLIDENGKILGEGSGNKIRNSTNYDQLSGVDLSRELFKISSPRIGTVMIERDAFLDVGGFDSSLFGGEEWEFWVRFSYNYDITHIKDIIYEKRVHSEQVSSTHEKERFYGRLEALTKMEKNFNFLTDLSHRKRPIFVRRISKLEIIDGNSKVAREVLKEQLKNIKPGFKDYFLLILTYLPKLNKSLLKTYLKYF